MKVTSVSVLKSILIWESSMIPTLVFLEWTSMSFLLELERESRIRSIAEVNSVISREFPLMRPSNGSPRSALELSSEELATFQANEFDECIVDI